VLDGEFRGKVRLTGAPESPILFGEGNLVQGKVLFRDRPFILESVKVTFDDPYGMNPKFNASAVSEINQYKIRVLAYGKSSSWKAEFNSTPYLPQNDIYSLLASGTLSSDGGNRFRTRDRSYVNQGEAASLVLHSLDFGKDFQSKTGFQFDVEEAIDQQSARSIFSPQNRADNVAAPKLVIKRQVGRKIGLSFGSTVGVGNQVQREVNAEYRLNNSLSVLGVWNNIEEANTRETRTSFGLDLKLNRRFK
jgi:translocation and assembly module TamB